MATIKSYTSLEQSRKLEEILPLESADMWYSYYGNSKYNTTIAYKGQQWFLCQIRNSLHDDIPCWSLAALLGALPDELEDNHFLTLEKEGKEYCCCYEDNNGNSFRHTFADNPIDACVAMIERLHELNLL